MTGLQILILNRSIKQRHTELSTNDYFMIISFSIEEARTKTSQACTDDIDDRQFIHETASALTVFLD